MTKQYYIIVPEKYTLALSIYWLPRLKARASSWTPPTSSLYMQLVIKLCWHILRQLTSHWNHWGYFKKCWCLHPISGEYGNWSSKRPGHWRFYKLLDDSQVESSLRSKRSQFYLPVSFHCPPLMKASLISNVDYFTNPLLAPTGLHDSAWVGAPVLYFIIGGPIGSFLQTALIFSLTFASSIRWCTYWRQQLTLIYLTWSSGYGT